MSDGWYFFNDNDFRYIECKTPPLNPFASRTLAFTEIDTQWNEYLDNDGRDPGEIFLPSVIYLCPWFIDKLSAKGLLNPLIGVGVENAMRLSWDGILGKANGDTQIDLLSRFEATILHELTHTIPAQVSTDAGTTGDSSSYGWLNCVSLKKQRNAGKSSSDRK